MPETPKANQELRSHLSQKHSSDVKFEFIKIKLKIMFRNLKLIPTHTLPLKNFWEEF